LGEIRLGEMGLGEMAGIGRNGAEPFVEILTEHGRGLLLFAAPYCWHK